MILRCKHDRRLKLIYIGTDLLDHARAVVAWRVRQRRQSRISSRANVSLHRVNADGVDSNEHFTRAGSRRRHFFEPKNFRLRQILSL